MTILAGKLALVGTPWMVGAILFDATVFGGSLLSVVGPLVVLALAGVFTIRSNAARIWRDNFRAAEEKITILETDRDEQRELKHDALTRVTTLEGQLHLEQAKTDLSPVVAALGEQRAILEQIRDGLGGA